MRGSCFGLRSPCWPLQVSLFLLLSPGNISLSIRRFALASLKCRCLIDLTIRQHPKIPNPEQTCSLLSWLMYTFMDSVIFNAYRSPDLIYEDIPPLADSDYAGHLKKQSFRVRRVPPTGLLRLNVYFVVSRPHYCCQAQKRVLFSALDISKGFCHIIYPSHTTSRSGFRDPDRHQKSSRVGIPSYQSLSCNEYPIGTLKTKMWMPLSNLQSG